MKVSSSGIVDGIILDKYGKRGEQFNTAGMATYSIPIKIENAPKETVSYAIVLDDKDSVPVCGFVWIHWLVADLVRNELGENESISPSGFVQGATSWYGRGGGLSAVESSVYGGMAPPNSPHTYEIHVYALDTKLGLKTGFFLNELYKAMDGHVLDYATLKGTYIN